MRARKYSCRNFIRIMVAGGVIALMAAPAQAELRYRHIPGIKKPNNAGAKSTLDRKSVTDFIYDIQKTVHSSNRRNAAMPPEDIAAYFNRHIADSALFVSTMRYEMPSYPAQESTMQIDKAAYIDGVLGGTHMMDNYEPKVEIGEITIDRGKRRAQVRTVIHEKGEMPWPDGTAGGDGQRNLVPLPVKGVSTCDQTISIGDDRIIRMETAQCYSVLSFDPFEHAELGPAMFFGR